MRGDDVRVLKDYVLDGPQEKLPRRHGQAEFLGSPLETLVVSIRAKDNRRTIFGSVALETFPNGCSVIQGSGRGRNREIAIGISVHGFEEFSSIGFGIIMLMPPTVSSGKVDVLVLLWQIQIPWQGAKIDSLLGRCKGIFGHGGFLNCVIFNKKIGGYATIASTKL
jgi:hypothetical protein